MQNCSINLDIKKEKALIYGINSQLIYFCLRIYITYKFDEKIALSNPRDIII